MQKRRFPSDWLKGLKEKNDIVATISSYIPVEKRGRQYWARCPFHNEKTPSFAINEDGQFYHCFGCGESGDVITFVEKMDSITTGDAIRKLAESAGMELPMLEDSEKLAQKKKKRDNIIAALNLTKEHYVYNLYQPFAKIAQEYIKQRKFKKSDLDKFQIGYSHGNDIIEHLKQKGVSEEIMLAAGIISSSDGRIYDHVFNRLIFPILNSYGDCIGFSGRMLESNEYRAKYKNTSQTMVFDKGSSIYGIHLLKEEKRLGKLKEIVLVEGQIDVILMHSFGFGNTVASLGTAFTAKHAEQLKHISNEIVLLFDSDEAGEKAALRAVEILKPFGFNIRIARLPKGYDPDDFLKEFGADKMKGLLVAAKNSIEYRLDLLKERADLSKAKDKSSYIKRTLKLISSLETMSEKEVYLKIISENSKVPIDILRRDLKYAAGINVNKEEKDVLISSEDGNIKAIKYVLLSILKRKPFTQLDFDIKKHFFNPLFKNILINYEEVSKNSELGNGSINDLLNNLDEEEKLFVTELLEADYVPDKKYFDECVWNIVEVSLKMQQNVLNEEYKNSEDRDERMEIAKRLKEIIEKLKTKNIY